MLPVYSSEVLTNMTNVDRSLQGTFPAGFSLGIMVRWEIETPEGFPDEIEKRPIVIPKL
jgi:hypothetical protein